MSKTDNSISKLVEESNIDFVPVKNEFFIRLKQSDIDNDSKRIEEELKQIQAKELRKDKVLVKNKSDQDKLKEDAKFLSNVSNHPNDTIYEVYSVGPDTTVVKPGDQIVLRGGSRPSRIKYGIYFYLAYSENSVCGIVKTSK